MTWKIAGFGGLPARGGVGLKPVLVTDTGTGRTALVLGHQAISNWWCAEDIEQHEESSVLTLISAGGQYFHGAVALYAHRDFVSPPAPEDGEYQLVLNPGDLRLERCQAWVDFLYKDEALEFLDGWVYALLEASRRALERGQLGACRREALRAQFALVERDYQVTSECREEILRLLEEARRRK